MRPSGTRWRCAAGALAFCVSVAPVFAKEKPQPKMQEPAKALTGCESLGAGYIKLEGTDTCVKASGRTTAEGAVQFRK